MKTGCKVATAEEFSVAKGENLVANATNTVAMSSPGSFGIIPVRIYDLRSIGLWCIKGTDKYLSTRNRFVFFFMHHDSIDLESFILI